MAMSAVTGQGNGQHVGRSIQQCTCCGSTKELARNVVKLNKTQQYRNSTVCCARKAAIAAVAAAVAAALTAAVPTVNGKKLKSCDHLTSLSVTVQLKILV
jgi:hypothetical protein